MAYARSAACALCRNYVRRLFRRRWLHAQLPLSRNESTSAIVASSCLSSRSTADTRPSASSLSGRDFFYPERLLLACCLSVWLQLLFSMGLVAFGRYLHSLLLGGAHAAQLALLPRRMCSWNRHTAGATRCHATLCYAYHWCSKSLSVNWRKHKHSGVTDAITVHPAAGLHRLTGLRDVSVSSTVLWRGVASSIVIAHVSIRCAPAAISSTAPSGETGGSSYIGYQAAFMIASISRSHRSILRVCTYLRPQCHRHSVHPINIQKGRMVAPRQQHVVALDLMYPPPPPSATSAYGDYLESISMRVGCTQFRRMFGHGCGICLPARLQQARLVHKPHASAVGTSANVAASASGTASTSTSLCCPTWRLD